MRRRDFLKAAGLAAGAVVLTRPEAQAAPPERPNVLWISTEDISPDLGCYGDTYAVTHRIDKLAKEGTRFDLCFAHMGVCAPARSGIITGMYPTSIGTNHMRCQGVPQPGVKCFTEYLRAAGYYCTNRSKTDYQFASPMTAWDTGRRDWKGRAKGQPFFSVINYTGTHESRARSKPSDKLKHDPAKATLPPYYPDTPIVRRDWAKYYDNLTGMDNSFAGVLKTLDDEGLADDTIVWFWGDHGRGLPRGKRWIYDSGLHVPLIIRVPAKWRKHVNPDAPDAFKPGTVNTDLVSFVDFAPTMLSLCGVPIPKHILGQAVLGPQKAKPRDYIYGARDRVDEAYDMIRCVRDKRYHYLRNFMRHLPRSLDVDYMNQMPTMKEMRRLFAEGKLKGPQLQYFEKPKPLEELYDTKTDPHEVNNLADRPEHRERLERLREALFAWMEQTGDFGLLPECEFDALKRPGDQYEVTSAPGVRPTKQGDGVVAELVCATPGASIAYQIGGAASVPEGDGIVLQATSARFQGEKPFPNKEPGNLSGWRNTKAWLSWQVTVPKAGKTPVHVVWGCGGRENSRYVVEIAGQKLEGSASFTGGFDTMKVARLGDVDIPKPGKHTVTLKPVVKPGNFQMDLQSVVLGGTNIRPSSGKGADGWKVYTVPIALAPGQVVTAKAVRLGFKDSKTIRYRCGDPALGAERANLRPHWKTVVDQSGVVGRALALKKLEGTAQFVPACEAALKDKAGSARYWAVLGIHHGSHEAERARYTALLRPFVKDPSHAVRIETAETLVDWGYPDEGLPVILAGLKHPLASGKLLAATALYHLGPKAKSALPQMQASGGYAARMAKHIRAQLGRK